MQPRAFLPFKKVLLLLCILSATQQIFAEDFLTLVRNKKISCSVSGNENSVHYAKPLKVKVKNNTASLIDLNIPSGFVFVADDSSFQNILVTQTMLASLEPSVSKEFVLYGMCMESSDRAPVENAQFSPRGMAEPKLVQLARFIEKNKFFTPAGQNAVWTYMNDLPLYAVSSIDTSQAYILQQFLSELTGKAIIPVPEDESYLYNYNERPKKFVVEGEINFHISYKLHVEWGLYNEDGILLRELYNGFLGPGDETLRFTYDASAYSDPVYYLKLVTDGELMYNRKLTFNDSD